MRRPTRGEVGTALLLSIPPGVGIAGLVGFILRTPLSVPAIVVGVLAAGTLFALLIVGVAVGEPDRSGFRLPDDRDG